MVTMTYNSLVSDLQDYLDRSDTNLIDQIPNFINLGEIRCSREVKNLGLKTSVISALASGTSVYKKPARWLETISINYGTNNLLETTLRESVSGAKTLTFAAAHDFSVGDPISVFNVSDSSYNGEFTVTATTQKTVSYINGSATESSTSDIGGRASKPLENRTYLKPRSYEFCCSYWPDRTAKGNPKFYADYDYDNFFIVPTPTIANPFEIIFFQRPEPLSLSNQQNWFTENSPDMLLYASLLESAPYLKNDERIPTWKDYYLQAANSIKLENQERKNDGTIMRVE